MRKFFQAFRLSGFQAFRLSGFQAFRLSGFQANSRIKFSISNFSLLSLFVLYVIFIYSSDLYSQNKIEVRIQSREKIKSIRI
ncbi:hypothetical protein B0192_16125, partial [Leptospira interrogans serovar Australis]